MATYAEILESLKKQRAEAEDITKLSFKKVILPALKKAKIETVEIYFDGCGDDGSINEISAQPDALPDLTKQNVEEWAYKLLEGTGVDWYNNDGGFGEITIDVENKSYSYAVNTRYTESSLEVSEEVQV